MILEHLRGKLLDLDVFELDGLKQFALVQRERAREEGKCLLERSDISYQSFDYVAVLGRDHLQF